MDIIEVKEWDQITGYEHGHNFFHIRLKTETDFYSTANRFKIDVAFKKGTELICFTDTLLFWFKQ